MFNPCRYPNRLLMVPVPSIKQKNMACKAENKLPALHAMTYRKDGQAYLATRSRRFMIEKMNNAESRQSATRTPHTTKRGRSPHNQAATAVR